MQDRRDRLDEIELLDLADGEVARRVEIGETPITEILPLKRQNRWTVPAAAELEYTIPQDSHAVQEVRKCVEFCRAALK